MKKKVRKKKKIKQIRRKKNPGGGWIFKGKYANKWKAFRFLSGRELFNGMTGYAEVKDKDEWWKVVVNREENIINILEIAEPMEVKYRFSGKSSHLWIDWRIGFNSQGPELQDSKGHWWSANIIKSGNNINVVDVRYEVKD